MSLSKPEVVDFVVRSRDLSSVELIVLDEGEIPAPVARLEALKLKLASYVNYVADGQYLEQAPGVPPERVCIRIVCHLAPTQEMQSLVALRAADYGVQVADIPVYVETDAEMRARVTRETEEWRKAHPEDARPWWKFW
ncbi:MAG: hypothetical protein IT190_11090 [Microbacteriaceae bacterium]|nr:hypothetical protein [Microbacteriaceae bacterium]